MRFRDLGGHGRILATGKDRVRFLNGLFSNDIAALRPGEGCHAAMLTVKGRVVGDAIVLCDEDALLVDLDPEVAPAVAQALERHLIVDEVTLDDQGAALDEIGVYGEDAAARLAELLGPIPTEGRYRHARLGATRVVRVDDLGLPGYRLLGGARALAERLCGGPAIPWLADEEAEVLRVEAGIPRHGVDMGQDYLPIESRLDDAISHTKGCYMGQEVIARATARGHINKRLQGLRLDGDAPAERGARLSAPGRDDAGLVTSSVRSPRFGAIALAYVHRTAWAPGTVVTVHDPGGERRATVSDLPFTSG